jgi:hypothetical protein
VGSRGESLESSYSFRINGKVTFTDYKLLRFSELAIDYSAVRQFNLHAK